MQSTFPHIRFHLPQTDASPKADFHACHLHPLDLSHTYSHFPPRIKRSDPAEEISTSVVLGSSPWASASTTPSAILSHDLLSALQCANLLLNVIQELSAHCQPETVNETRHSQIWSRIHLQQHLSFFTFPRTTLNPAIQLSHIHYVFTIRALLVFLLNAIDFKSPAPNFQKPTGLRLAWKPSPGEKREEKKTHAFQPPPNPIQGPKIPRV